MQPDHVWQCTDIAVTLQQSKGHRLQPRPSAYVVSSALSRCIYYGAAAISVYRWAALTQVMMKEMSEVRDTTDYIVDCPGTVNSNQRQHVGNGAAG